MPVGDQAWAFGLAMISVVQCVGYSSGGHINPAVTGAFVFTGKITWLRALAYLIAQITGGKPLLQIIVLVKILPFTDHFFPGIAGAGILYAVTPEKLRGKLGATVVHDDVTAGQAVGVEAILTFLVVLTVFAATDTDRKMNDYGVGPLAIGVAYTAAHFMGVSACLSLIHLYWIALSVLNCSS
jgi:glycerol uptake facilitator-like aquaporin